MPRKIFNFSLELEIKSITCPGVWLCINGYVSLIISMLEMEYETKHVPPVFPLSFHEVFYFKKSVDNVYSLTNFQKFLREEKIHCLLVQWPINCSCDEGKVLAKFVGSLRDLLYQPSTFLKYNVNLLMEPSSSFPGILSPSIEIITLSRVVETTKKPIVPPNTLQNHIKHIDMKFVSKSPKRQRAVCHTYNYHKYNHAYESDEHLKENKFYTLMQKRNSEYRFDDEFESPPKVMIENKCLSPKINIAKNKIVKIHQLNSCAICSEYYSLFKDVSLPSVKCDHYRDAIVKPTYEINMLLNKIDDDFPEHLHEKLENIFSDSSRNLKVFRSETDENRRINKSDVHFTTYGTMPDCLISKFNKINLKCLCR